MSQKAATCRRAWLGSLWPGLLGLLLLSGCIYAPRTVTVYDPDCRITSRQMVLQGQQVASIAGCRNEGCLTLLVAMGAVSAVSVVVSGSVVMVGNVVYWFEKVSQCRPAEPPAAVPPPTLIPPTPSR